MNENQVLINELIELDKYNNKIQSTYQIILLLLKKDNKNKIVSFFQQNNIENIYIYGAGLIGKIVYDQLSNISSLKVHAIIDQSIHSDFDFKECPIYTLEETLIKEYPVLITPTFAYGLIKSSLSEHGFENYISIINIIDYDFFMNT